MDRWSVSNDARMTLDTLVKEVWPCSMSYYAGGL